MVWGPCLQVDAVISKGCKHAEAGHDRPNSIHAVYDAHARMLCAIPHQLIFPLCRQCTTTMKQNYYELHMMQLLLAGVCAA